MKASRVILIVVAAGIGLMILIGGVSCVALMGAVDKELNPSPKPVQSGESKPGDDQPEVELAAKDAGMDNVLGEKQVKVTITNNRPSPLSLNPGNFKAVDAVNSKYPSSFGGTLKVQELAPSQTTTGTITFASDVKPEVIILEGDFGGETARAALK